jgi:hypothetical protein
VDRPIAVKAIANARLNLGVIEKGGENRGKEVEAYLASCIPSLPPGSPWCVAHVRFRLKQAATDFGTTYDATMPRTGYTPDWVRWAKRTGHWISVADAKANPGRLREGDIVCFYFKALGRHAHMGMIDKVRADGSGVLTVEGNTSPEQDDDDYVDRDGDGLYPKVRDWSELGEFGGFITIDF